jgi:hypothetical protein
MLNFPFNSPIKKSLDDYIKLSNIISMNKMKERYENKTLVKSEDYNINFCELSDFSSSCENDSDEYDSDDENMAKKNNKYFKYLILSFIGTGSIISLSFAFYKIYILYIL